MNASLEHNEEKEEAILNIINPTQNIQLNSGWIYDCIYLRQKFNHHKKLSSVSYDNNNEQINGQQYEESKDNLLQQTNRLCKVIACTKQGKLIEFERSFNGEIQNQKLIYSLNMNEEFMRLYEDQNHSIDYQNKYLLVSGTRKRIHVFKDNSNEERKENDQVDISWEKVHEYIPALDRNVFGICGYRNHSNKIFSAGTHNITLYDLQKEKVARRIKNHIENGVVDFNKQMNILATCGVSHDIQLYDDRQHKLILSLKGHTSNVVRLVSLQNNQQFFIASGSHDQSLILWDIRYQPNSRIYQKHHTNAIFGLDYDEENNIIFSCGWDKRVKALELNTFKVIGSIQSPQQDKLITCRYNSYSKELMTSSRDGSIQLYSTFP